MLTSKLKLVSGMVLGTAAISIAPPVQATTDYAIGRCVIDNVNPSDLYHGTRLHPVNDANSYMWNYHNHSDPRYSEYYKTGDFFNGGAITVKFPPVLGKVELDPTAPSNINSKEAGWYYYSLSG